MLNWSKRIFSWLWDAKYLWLALIIILGPSSYALFVPEITESRIRLAGLFLQLCGVLTVLFGILDLRKRFDHPSLLAMCKHWLMSFPPYHLPKRTANLNVELGGYVLTAGGVTMTHRAGPNATLEDRVRVLESNVDRLEHLSTELQLQVNQENRERGQELLSERQSRVRELEGVRSFLETTQTSGVYLSLIGLVWVFVGLIMSTASIEIAQLFK